MGISFRDLKKTILNKRVAWLTAIFALVLQGQACKETLDPLEMKSMGVYNYGAVDARFCTSPPAPAQQKLKYLFILDHSASNKPGITQDINDVTNTDADGSRRYGPMVNFINNLALDDKTTPYFGLIDFDDTAYQATGLNGFEPDPVRFLNIAKTDWIGTGTALAPSPNDSGFTNYQAALNLAYTMIQQDAQGEAALQSGAPVTSVYQIVFVSDGIPTIQAVNGTLYTQIFNTDIQPVIANILALKNTPSLAKFIANISLNTAYYFNTADGAKPAAITLLGKMATSGNGMYEQYASGQQILYQTFAPASRSVVNQLVDVFVQNENGVWWDDGHFMLDSDGDGLPDAIERQMGSSAFVQDSDGNGVSDLVEYRTKGMACNDPSCTQAGRDPYSICSGYGPSLDANNNVTFQSSGNDGMNDCEKFLMNGTTQSFNGNGNMIPDFLALVNSMSIQVADAAVALADPFGNGMNNYQKLKMGLPIQISRDQTGEFETRNTSLTVDSVDDMGVTCYHLSVDHIALSSAKNKMKIFVIQNSALLQDKAFLMTAEKGLDETLNATFDVGEFK
jgi:hypothetical protein